MDRWSGPYGHPSAVLGMAAVPAADEDETEDAAPAAAGEKE